MSFFAEMLAGKQIQDALADSEVVYILLTDGTQITIRGTVAVESPAPAVRCSTAGQRASLR